MGPTAAEVDARCDLGRYFRCVPITLSEVRPRGWLVATASGCLTLEEVLAFLQSARAGNDRRMMPLLFDARGATTDISEAEVAQAVEAVRQVSQRQGDRGHVAIVADDNLLFRRMLFYETSCAAAGVRTIRVFRQRSDAECWLEAVSAARHYR
jgi:hypothetical protein